MGREEKNTGDDEGVVEREEKREELNHHFIRRFLEFFCSAV